MSDGQILHGSHNGVEVLRYRGDVRHTICVALDRYLQQLLERPDLQGFVVDLTDVQSIDSTNLGILARLARAMQKAGLPKVTLISNQPDINELLDAVGFDQVFNIVDRQDTETEDLDEIQPEEAGDQRNSRLLLEAHRALMDLNEQNRALFKDVVKAFEKELKS
ncbi:STAS domain-containing protein [Sedimenticola sp.]|uniref:STAS domain-containing protein n=1 Tax=Sedimenticola sp. TaxID=1940285 RepID=UPI003D13FFCA